MKLIQTIGPGQGVTQSALTVFQTDQVHERSQHGRLKISKLISQHQQDKRVGLTLREKERILITIFINFMVVVDQVFGLFT